MQRREVNKRLHEIEAERAAKTRERWSPRHWPKPLSGAEIRNDARRLLAGHYPQTLKGGWLAVGAATSHNHGMTDRDKATIAALLRYAINADCPLSPRIQAMRRRGAPGRRS